MMGLEKWPRSYSRSAPTAQRRRGFPWGANISVWTPHLFRIKTRPSFQCGNPALALLQPYLSLTLQPHSITDSLLNIPRCLASTLCKYCSTVLLENSHTSLKAHFRHLLHEVLFLSSRPSLLHSPGLMTPLSLY